MRRTSTLEVQMTTLHIHPHAAFDRFPMLVESVKEEFGTDGLMSNVERFIEAERADFHWDGRLAEMNLGAYESLDDEDEAFEARRRSSAISAAAITSRPASWMPNGTSTGCSVCAISTASRAPNRRSWRAVVDPADRFGSGVVTASLPSCQATTPPGAWASS